MSIRLWSDGHSFPAELSQSIAQKQSVEVELLAPRTTLVPAELFHADQAAEYLRLAGLPCRESELPVWSESRQGVVAVMAIDRSVRELLPAQVTFSSPLLEAEMQTPNTLWIARFGELLYIKVWDEALRLAEVLSITGGEDLLYYIGRLGEWLPLKNYTLRVEGEEPRELRKLLKNYFK